VHLYYAYLAMVIEEERRAVTDRRSLASRAAAGRGPGRPSMRRRLALGLATVSRVSAAAVRRLDACLADDLARTLAPTDGA
jgi:hypothetical protein